MSGTWQKPVLTFKQKIRARFNYKDAAHKLSVKAAATALFVEGFRSGFQEWVPGDGRAEGSADCSGHGNGLFINHGCWMKAYYQENHKKYHEQTFDIDPASFLAPLVRCLTPRSSILDVGCSSGRDMRWLQDRGFQPTGFERSSGLAALAREHSGCSVLEGDFEVCDFSGS